MEKNKILNILHLITKISYLSISLSEVLKYMDKYNIKYSFEGEKDINNIFIYVLKKELKKYILMICQKEKCMDSSSSLYLSQRGGRIC